ncbi:MAG: RNA 2'-phosphotransferase [Flavobacteriaceae bacterium]|nr:RNA 2'-phosphotransferase [Flavobacteriaceae bacterium]
MKTKYISKFLSYILRHHPEKIGLELDNKGWANVDELLEKINKEDTPITREDLELVVAENDKKRFAFNEDKTKIRASQGHSIKIDLGYREKEPPAILYHGTVGKVMYAIKENGLLKMSRHHVHLSEDRETANKVGSRRGKPIILSVRSGEMYRDNIQFFQSENGVWLTEHVDPKYIEFK